MLHASGPLLSIDVGRREYEVEEIDDVLEAYVGGRGLGTKLAHDRTPFDADPLGPENRLYLTSGPMQHSQMSFTGRMNITSVSPLTDGLASTNAGGFLSRNFTSTGYSAVEITGQSDELIAVHVTDDGVEFEAVPELEEARVSAVTEELNDRRGLESEHLATVGPAGENRVRFASVMTSDSRAFGRGGMGAVLGAKNVKCLSFRGESTPDVEIPEDVQSEVHEGAATSDSMLKQQGTAFATDVIHDNFSLPTRYFSEQSFEGVEAISGNAVTEKKYKKGTCSSCAFACKLPTRDEETGLETEGPEFETIFSFGSSAGVGDIVDVMKSNELCDELGMDTISCGVAVSAYLAAEDEFGNADLVHDLVEKVARREGIGDTLAEGVDRFHDELGVENWTVKGLEFAGHDGRVIHGQGLSYAVANRGADHMYSTLLEQEYFGELEQEGLDGKPPALVRAENWRAFQDSAIICSHSASSGEMMETHAERLFQSDVDELLAVGERVVEHERHFNNERGMDREDDTLPYEIPDFEAGLDEYYDLRGWTQNGTISDEQLGD
ncbi:Aldehyde ferredoxin oxidoreductase (plasmid) [Haloterrigena turkmenica DSM 5511]|uniref:Aldehyde ferredoxin oxidoreductase n=1 Tax=Haloterrigena turkmenica (strain ATCC 51198 / DSM 5511 / JCM 9101 / NCIMB 13204 / VKM B-1734 / 4k) TaxID=543526 RepID=D2RZZ6_HALTV|nr:aldehyde ferredoxin oxidoreductase C-terminal domain-containing protein [Haloterrigena turkmenica]ADB62693.1 Aldehyde ferredoxin oxidoreductase [Haloterrigena turkmenica DSM 5511]